MVARFCDNGELESISVDSRYRRKSTRKVTLKALIEFMRNRNISFEGFGTDIEAQKVILGQLTGEFKNLIAKTKKQSGVLANFKGLPNNLLYVVHNLDPLESLQGVSEDKRRVMIFQRLIEVMEHHIRVRGLIAKAKK